MNGDVMKYLGGVAFLVFVYLVVTNATAATNIINQLSKANSNTILALQGRNPGL